MKYQVTITETLEKVITVEADTKAEAEWIAENDWLDSKYVLSWADDFTGVRFRAEPED